MDKEAPINLLIHKCAVNMNENNLSGCTINLSYDRAIRKKAVDTNNIIRVIIFGSW